jgi:uncharacterized protein YggE
MSNFIQVEVTGSTETAFTSASFRVHVTTFGDTGPEAKEKAKPTVEAIKAVIARFAERASIEADRVKTTFDVDVNKLYDRNTGAATPNGYKAVYTAVFSAKNVVEATAVHDALTSIAGVEAPSPVFHADNSPAVFKRAFEDAATKAQTRFKDQCDVLKLHMSNFECVNWVIERNRGGGGKVMALAASANGEGGEPIDVEPGRAVLDVTVTFYFQKRPQITDPSTRGIKGHVF